MVFGLLFMLSAVASAPPSVVGQPDIGNPGNAIRIRRAPESVETSIPHRTIPAALQDSRANPPIHILGAGATYPSAMLQRMCADFNRRNPTVVVEYHALGTGSGIRALSAGAVDFACADPPLSAVDSSALAERVLEIPLCGRALAIVYNVPGVQSGLHLSGTTLADIYQGAVRFWDDRRIREQNPRRRLPHLRIVPIHWRTGHADNYLLTQYLSAESPTWNRAIGLNVTGRWPVGYGTGNGAGMGYVNRVKGGIGYVDLATSVGERFKYASVKNPRGRYVAPSVSSAVLALEAKADTIAADPGGPVICATGTGSYPIVGLSYVLVPRKSDGSAHGKALADFLTSALRSIKRTGTPTNCIPLPEGIARRSETLLAARSASEHPESENPDAGSSDANSQRNQQR